MWGIVGEVHRAKPLHSFAATLFPGQALGTGITDEQASLYRLKPIKLFRPGMGLPSRLGWTMVGSGMHKGAHR
jgi:hypothetical protein